MGLFSIFGVENFIKNLNLSISGWFKGWFRGWFKRENSPIHKSRTTIKVEKLEQHNTIVVTDPSLIPNLIGQGAQSIEQLRQPSFPVLPSSTSDAAVIPDEDKKSINKRIDDAVSFLNLNRLDEARALLLTILGEIRENPALNRERVRVYNNLGVVYNRPKPEGDYDKAIEYFNNALEVDAQFVKSRMNIASAYLNKDTTESIQKGYTLIQTLWETEKNPEIFQILLWGMYKSSDSKAVLDFVQLQPDEIKKFIEKKDTLLNMLSAFYLELGDFERSLAYIEKSISLSPNEPEFLTMKARGLLIRAQKNNQIPSDFDIVPQFSDYRDVESALELFNKAEEAADVQRKEYLLAEIRYGITTCLIWLGKYDESKYKLKQLLTTPDLPELLVHQISVLDFAGYLYNRDFETAYNVLKASDTYSKITYEEKRRIGKVFLLNGAPEQAENLFNEIQLEAEQKKDVFYWLDFSTVYVLLEKQQEAISAAMKAKNLSDGMSEDVRKLALSHYNAVTYHYVKSEGGENSENNRLVQGMMEFQNEFPEEKIITSIKAINEQGELTTEIKDVFTSMKERYEYIRKAFKENPIPTYYLEKTFHRSYASQIAFREDPEFTLSFTSVDPVTIEELNTNFSNSPAYVFDYLSLLDLSKMGFLGFLDRLKKPVFIHQKLFEKIQGELLQNEIGELRALWNFLRKNRAVQIVKDKINIQLNAENLGSIFDEWLVESVKLAKKENAALVTNDFSLYRFLKSENIIPLNISPLLKYLLEQKFIDEKMFSRAVGDLAERFYIFISYRGEDLFEIVLEDKGRITPRSYHLIMEVFLPGSDVVSFTRVFAHFISLFWKTGSLPEEKVNWVKFLTNTITKIIDEKFIPLQGKKVDEVDIESVREELKPIISHLVAIWKFTTQMGTRDDLIELEKIIDETLDKRYLAKSKEVIHSNVLKRITELTPKSAT